MTGSLCIDPCICVLIIIYIVMFVSRLNAIIKTHMDHIFVCICSVCCVLFNLNFLKGFLSAIALVYQSLCTGRLVTGHSGLDV